MQQFMASVTLPSKRLSPWSHTALVIACLALLNLPFWISQKLLFVQQPFFNLDLALALALCRFHLGIGGLALLLVCAVDIAQAASLSYHFGNAVDLLSTWRFAALLNWQKFLTPSLGLTLLLLALFVGAIFALIRFLRPGMKEIAWIAAVFILLDALNGSMQFGSLASDRYQINANIAGSPVWNVIHTQFRMGMLDDASAPLAVIPGAPVYKALDAWRIAHPGRSLLVILVESMGWLEDASIRALLNEALATPSVSQRWSVEIRNEAFSGSTTYGELRTLCGLRGHYTHLTATQGAECLPARMLAAGYETWGMHGLSARMFDRGEWWRTIGLDRRLFAPDFPGTAKVCEGAFTGVCDRDVIQRALDEVQKERRLVYALTLDTHLPLNDEPVPLHLAQVCRQHGLAKGTCALLSAHVRLLSTIAVELTARQGQPMVVIAGDHSPPFNASKDRSAFNPRLVPVYMLRPREFSGLSKP